MRRQMNKEFYRVSFINCGDPMFLLILGDLEKANIDSTSKLQLRILKQLGRDKSISKERRNLIRETYDRIKSTKGLDGIWENRK